MVNGQMLSPYPESSHVLNKSGGEDDRQLHGLANEPDITPDFNHFYCRFASQIKTLISDFDEVWLKRIITKPSNFDEVSSAST